MVQLLSWSKPVRHTSLFDRSNPEQSIQLVLLSVILHSVEEFHSRNEELELDQEDRLITADVKDFFVVGDH